MTSYIRLRKVCHHCGNHFIAKTTATKYCGDNCSKRAYKERKKLEKINASNKETIALVQRPIKELQVKEFLTISDTCQLINISRSTLYRLIKDQRIKSAKVGSRVLIRKSDLNKLFI